MIRNPEKCLLTSLFPEFQPSIKKCHFSLFNIFVIFSRTKNPANSHKCEGLVRMFLRFRFCGIVCYVLYRFSFPQNDL